MRILPDTLCASPSSGGIGEEGIHLSAVQVSGRQTADFDLPDQNVEKALKPKRLDVGEPHDGGVPTDIFRAGDFFEFTQHRPALLASAYDRVKIHEIT